MGIQEKVEIVVSDLAIQGYNITRHNTIVFLNEEDSKSCGRWSKNIPIETTFCSLNHVYTGGERGDAESHVKHYPVNFDLTNFVRASLNEI